jgi:hypothetical protein
VFEAAAEINGLKLVVQQLEGLDEILTWVP